MSTTLSVQLTPDAARAMREDATPEATAIREAVQREGLELKPLYPGEADPLLAVHYAVEAPDEEEAKQLQAVLLDTPGVDGAYIKPGTFLP